MRRAGILVGAVALTALAACSDNDAGTEPKPASNPVAASTSPSVPSAASDGRTHTFRVTIRDVRGVNEYRAGETRCLSNAPKEFPHRLVVGGPDGDKGVTTLKSFEIPLEAQLSMGACESKMTITVPYAPRYTMDIGMEGSGIAGPDVPEPTWVTTKGTSQDVTVVSQVVTIVKSDS
ncbi:hypothetical protein GEV29_15465 [Aeromicrobium sp. SMF47]|uniref:hypothetical protein n=1 Tax=Aeromicrobium yanjiei TaxID=2662028 RepID=UPI00129D6037|nr:hypothetical protein [Aeromicrobium yanjiei]MRJ77940.1 hypothetical protein [Aeromicrobium yanjiei]